MKQRNLIAALVLLAFSGGYAYMTANLPDRGGHLDRLEGKGEEVEIVDRGTLAAGNAPPHRLYFRKFRHRGSPFPGHLRLNHAADRPANQLSRDFSRPSPCPCPGHPLTVPAGRPRIEVLAD